MKLNATQLRVGMIINHDNELYRITYMMHVTPGKGQACVQTKLKNIMSGKNLEHRFRSNDKVDKAILDTRKMQYLYQEADAYIFMDNETFEQSNISSDLIGDSTIYLKESDTYDITFHETTPVGVTLPQTVELKVEMAPPEIKKATATNSLRPVTLENGMEVNAPGFIKSGDIIRVNTETNDYVERV